MKNEHNCDYLESEAAKSWNSLDCFMDFKAAMHDISFEMII